MLFMTFNTTMMGSFISNQRAEGAMRTVFPVWRSRAISGDYLITALGMNSVAVRTFPRTVAISRQSENQIRIRAAVRNLFVPEVNSQRVRTPEWM